MLLKTLKLSFFCGGSSVPKSEAKVPYFLQKDEVSLGGKWTVYLNSVKGIEESSSLISSVSNVIIELYGGLLGRRTVLIPQMLTCPIDDIWGLLDASGVRQDDSYCTGEIKVFPTPGKFIPLVYHHLLNESFEEFDPDDYVEDAWKLPEVKCRKIIKRLFLQWHPDKNVGDEEFCTEFSKHIQSETSRLERGEPRGSQQSTDIGSSRGQNGSYGQFFNCWGERAREHHTQPEEDRSR